MAGEDSDLEKTEEPTQRKLDDAKERGQILTSQDAFVLAAIGTGAGIFAAGFGMLPRLADDWAAMLRISGDPADLMLPRLAMSWKALLIGGLAAAAPVLLAVVLMQTALGGVQFAPKALGFRFEKLDLLRGMLRLVSAKALVNLLKSLVKVALLGSLAWGVFSARLPDFIALGQSDARADAAVLGGMVVSLLGRLSLGLAIVAVADLVWQYRSRMAGLRMTKDEVRRESKEQNGSPEVKGKIRQKQMQTARRAGRQRASVADVPQATAVITNPSHFAVALRFVPGETPAPVIVSMGQGPIAADIIARARGLGIHTLQMPPLARALYFTGDIGTQIDERLFSAVAIVLAFLFRLDRGERPDDPNVDLPPDLRFDSHGRPETDARGGLA